MDVAFVWQQWAVRCQQVEQLQHTIDERMADILRLMHKPSGPRQGLDLKEDVPLILDHGEFPSL